MSATLFTHPSVSGQGVAQECLIGQPIFVRQGRQRLGTLKHTPEKQPLSLFSIGVERGLFMDGVCQRSCRVTSRDLP